MNTNNELSQLPAMFTMYEPDHWAILLQTGYNQFATKNGVSGLAKISGKRIKILAVVVDQERCGKFRNFVQELKENFDEIFFVHDWNPVLTDALARYGFKKLQWREADELQRGQYFKKEEALCQK